MKCHRVIWAAGLGASLALALAAPGYAGEPTASPAAAIAVSQHDQPAARALALPAGWAEESIASEEASSDAALDNIAGRGTDVDIAVALTEQSLSAVNTGNTINAGTVGSGAINMQDNALSGFSGISNVMMNTGHNNNLQSNMSVTVIISP